MFNIFRKKSKVEEIKKEANIGQRKVLMIDDNSLNMKAATILLEEYNIVVKTSSSGSDALEVLEHDSDFTLILMDNMMPGLTGVETLKRLKSNPEFNIPVVALTAYDVKGEEEELLNNGFDYFLKKPLNRSDLDVLLKKIIKFKQILIVDDDKLSLTISDKFLKRYNVITTLVTSGRECLDSLPNNYDLIFLDDSMPGMTGVETLKSIREVNENAIVVALTGNNASGDRKKYLSLGFDDYLAKPINDDYLEDILKRLL